MKWAFCLPKKKKRKKKKKKEDEKNGKQQVWQEVRQQRIQERDEKWLEAPTTLNALFD